MLLKLNLFDKRREFLIFLSFIITILLINIFFKYQTYKELKKYPVKTITATVLKQYQKTKRGKTYTVLKLRSNKGFDFFTTTKEDIKDLTDDRVRLKVVTKKISFLDLFKGFYAPSFYLELLKKDNLKHTILHFITSQHQNPKMQELFSALFLAKPISHELRENVSNLGISHLIAISGFHLGVLFFVLYFLLSKPYKFLQDRYFPFRNRRFDLTIFITFLLFLYLYFLGFVPSLVRSYVMLVVGFYLYDRFYEIISFEVLVVAVLLIVAFIPSFFFSIGFWFSVSGVFFIYLFLSYFSSLKEWQIVVFLNIWVYIMMLPIIHYVFVKFTFLQLFSPLLSIVFIIFYPLELFLHLVGQGDLLDSLILKLFNLQANIYKIQTPLWFLILWVSFMLFLAYKSPKIKQT